jgi:predicted transcriptional regulator
MVIGDMGRRSRLEIYFDLLEVVERGVHKPTRIMYRTNLSWKTLREVISVLTSKGFISEEEAKNSKRYRITEKGRNVLFYRRKSLEGLTVKKLWARP